MSTKDVKGTRDVENIKSDVVIVGGGCGLAAAVAAAEKGASVVLLEKRRKAGGNTAMAGGFLAAESPMQKRMKIEASREEIFKASMDFAHWNINPKIIRAMIDKSGDTVRWMENMGLNFKDVSHFFHNQLPRIYHVPEGNGAALVKILLKRCKDLGVSIFCQTPAKKILLGKSGEVTGVLAEEKEKRLRIKTKTAVIVTGGFSGNKKMLRKYCPLYTNNISLNGVPLMGDGLNMAIEAGAAVEGLGTLLAMGPFFEGSKYVHCTAIESYSVWLNSNGERFINEDSTIPSETANALNRQPGRVCYALYDEETKRIFMEEGLYKGVIRPYIPLTKMTELDDYLKKDRDEGKVRISRSWKEIADWMGADPKILRRNINEYNAYCDQGYDELFFKKRSCLKPLRNPPFYALRCGQAFHGTIGGIKISQLMEVLDKKDIPIKGLYAAGNDTGGWIADTYNYVLSGTALAFAINSSRIAGENAASYISNKTQ
jgi:fumarate reductase flavoprotein subunit